MKEQALYNFYAKSEMAAPHSSFWQKKRDAAKLLHQLQLSLHTHNISEADIDELNVILQQQIDKAQEFPHLDSRAAWLAETDHGSDGLLHIEMTPLLGTCNAVSPEISIWFEGKVVKADVMFDQLYEGNIGMVHGGFIAAIFDEVLGAAQALSGETGFTGTLKTIFHKPTPICQTLSIEARLVKHCGRKIFVEAEMYLGEEKTASAEAVFIRAV